MEKKKQPIPIIAMDHICKQYATGVEALHDISIRIDKGEFVFVVGKSGSGKSTFIKLLLKELDPTEGRIFVGGRQVTHLKRKQVSMYRRKIGVVFQDFRLLKNKTVYENVAFAQRIIGMTRREIASNVPIMLEMVGLEDKAEAYPNELSGGEQQRVAIARALINKPTILLADEPTGNLDPGTAWDIMMLLQEVNQMGTTVVVVTHNNDVVDVMQKRVINLEDGVLVRDEKKGGYEYERA
jgi:cell division transport system ATP-binding protein